MERATQISIAKHRIEPQPVVDESHFGLPGLGESGRSLTDLPFRLSASRLRELRRLPRRFDLNHAKEFIEGGAAGATFEKEHFARTLSGILNVMQFGQLTPVQLEY